MTVKRLFEVESTIDGGANVVAVDTGRPVVHRHSRASANGVARRLNEAARTGTLAHALGGERKAVGSSG